MDANLSGTDLARAFKTAADHVAAAAAAIDAINVYPVPDGDTGTNMAATLRGAVSGIVEETSAREVLQAVARGALFGARGNSGVILSQALRGLANAARADVLEPDALIAGLAEAADAAYAAISEPREGTMLTVLRVAAERATGTTCLAVLRSALAGAEEAERETINQLDRLREAGVTDAGGEGICAILRALVASIAGEPLPVVEPGEAPLARLVDHGEEYGYCTEFLVEAADGQLDIGRVRAFAEGGGNRSVIVVGDPTLLRIHVHTDRPGEFVDQAKAFGAVSATKIEDMGQQHREMRAKQARPTGLGLLALCEGAGFASAFRSLGAVVLERSGRQRPSVQQVVGALEEMAHKQVVILPNHKDLVPVAMQAVELWDGAATVVPSKSMPQGLAAALAFDADAAASDLVPEMTEALASVRTVECTVATETRTADGVPIAKGEVVVLVDGKAAAATATLVEGVAAGLRQAGGAESSLITLYSGSTIQGDEVDALREAVAAAFQGVEVEVVDGGQDLYPVIASVE